MEKMKVLKMLEDGKITADEAAKLLQAVGGTGRSHDRAPQREYSEPPRQAYNEPPSHKYDEPSRHEYDGSPRQTYDRPPWHEYDEPPRDIAGELSRKIETFAKDMEPKIARFTEVVVEKTANVADKITKSLSEAYESRQTWTSDTEPFERPVPSREYRTDPYEKTYHGTSGTRRDFHADPPSPHKPTHYATKSPARVGDLGKGAAPGASTERSFELKVHPEYNELNLSALNGDVLIKGYNGDKITARISWKPRKRNADLDLACLGNKYYLNYEEEDFESINIDAYVPETMFNRISICTVNGKIDISTLKCDYLNVSNSNGETKVNDIKADNIRIENNNAKTIVTNISGGYGHIENSNGVVQADMLDISRLKVSTFNAPVTINVAMFNIYATYFWTVETNNGKLSLNLPTHPTLGYDIKAGNTLGIINIGLTGLNYTLNTPSAVEARSIDYDVLLRKVELTLETSNAPLIVN